jgi:hypothetical protein
MDATGNKPQETTAGHGCFQATFFLFYHWNPGHTRLVHHLVYNLRAAPSIRCL